jgi:N6-adenosine-specific RNA methylase IME4
VVRAERRAGELLAEMRENGERANGYAPLKVESPAAIPLPPPPTLSDLGVTPTQSSRWQKLARLDDDAFEARVDQAQREAVRSVEATAAERLREKQARRAEREAELGAKQCALPAKRYGVILADPEWRFEVWSRETGMDRAADNHYPTSAVEAIAARDVASIAADDCVLFLWATAPMLPQALEVMRAWGFVYKSNLVWAKPDAGTGYWARSYHEHLLIGVKGVVPAPAPGTQPGSVIEGPATRHSEKPGIFQEIIECMFPSLPKIELNARRTRLGWDAWGLEAPPPSAATVPAASGGPVEAAE